MFNFKEIFMEIGFIGLGAMGSRIAKNILIKRKKLNVYNRTREKLTSLVELGAIPFNSPKELAKNSDIIFLMLSNSEAVKEVLLGNDGCFYGAKKDTYFIDLSTIQPKVSKYIYTKAKEKGYHYLDSPVLGSIDRAEQATLTIIVGGDKEDFDFIWPYLKDIGNSIHYIGESGSGSKLKLIVNSMFAQFPLVLAESINIAQKSGLDLNIALNVLKETAFAPAIKYFEERVVKKDFSPRFKLELMLKDVSYAKELADDGGVKTLILDKVKEAYELAVKQGHTGKDYSAVSLIYG